MESITIGGLSMRTGCNIETIRYYERIGVLPGRQGTHEGKRRVSESLSGSDVRPLLRDDRCAEICSYRRTATSPWVPSSRRPLRPFLF